MPTSKYNSINTAYQEAQEWGAPGPLPEENNMSFQFEVGKYYRRITQHHIALFITAYAKKSEMSFGPYVVGESYEGSLTPLSIREEDTVGYEECTQEQWLAGLKVAQETPTPNPLSFSDTRERILGVSLLCEIHNITCNSMSDLHECYTRTALALVEQKGVNANTGSYDLMSCVMNYLHQESPKSSVGRVKTVARSVVNFIEAGNKVFLNLPQNNSELIPSPSVEPIPQPITWKLQALQESKLDLTPLGKHAVDASLVTAMELEDSVIVLLRGTEFCAAELDEILSLLGGKELRDDEDRMIILQLPLETDLVRLVPVL